jgi:thiol-disulfide isomerase/thioredoxin
MAIVAVAVVVVVVAVMVIVKISGGSSPAPGPNGPSSFAAPASMVRAASSVPASTADAVGLPSAVSPPQLLSGQPPLTDNGKPAVVYVGAEYCPYCAAERWAMVVALSRFGTFSNLRETHSSLTDVYSDTITFSFYGSTYTSRYLTFDPTEMYTNQPASNGNGYQTLQPLVGLAKTVFAKYDAPPFVPSGGQGAFPFVDFGNRVLVSGASYSPQVLSGLTANQIASDLSDPSSPVAQSIVGTASYLTAALCAVTSGAPSSVCQEPYVIKAANAMKLKIK